MLIRGGKNYLSPPLENYKEEVYNTDIYKMTRANMYYYLYKK